MINDLMRVVPVGKNNAIHQQELARLLGCAPVTVKNMIRAARKAGVPILSNINGYWIAENDKDKKEFAAVMRKQAVTRLKSMKAITSTIEELNGQMSFTGAHSGTIQEAPESEQVKN